MMKVNGGLIRLALLMSMGLALSVQASETNTVTLHLKNGDRLTGQVLSETAERIVLTTPWNTAIYVPKSAIQEQVASEQVPTKPKPDGAVLPATQADAKVTTIAGGSEPPTPAAVAQSKQPPKSTKANQPKYWKWDLRLGTDFISGAKDRAIYSGQTSLVYTRNYKSNPKKFLRNRIEYRVNYGETDNQVSANNMAGADKLDFDVFGNFYGYAALGAGYDKVRKIEFQFELGPGLGYHLLAEKSLVVDTELGLNYQYREGLGGAPDREVVQARVGQELTWEVLPKITFSESVAFLPFLDELGQYQVRVEGNLGFGIVRHLSLNLAVLNLYDTQPAPGVPNNEFQFRSSLGVNF